MFESVQFGLLALGVPALVALGAPWRRLHARRQGGCVHAVLLRCAEARRRKRGVVRALPALAGYLVAIVLWRLPTVVDWTSHSIGGVVAEAATFVLVGPLLWSELVVSPPLVPRSVRGWRIALAVAVMWLTWVLAYFLGFARGLWFPAYRHVGGPLSSIADQQLGSGVLWAMSATAFVPVVFANLMRFLAEEDDVDDELRRLVRDAKRSSPLG